MNQNFSLTLNREFYMFTFYTYVNLHFGIYILKEVSH